MITLFNNTNRPFKFEHVVNCKNKNDKLSVTYGKMKFDMFLGDKSIEKLKSIIPQTGNSIKSLIVDTRLYFNNISFDPIAVESTSRNGANFLILAHRLNVSERVIRVEQNGTLGLERSMEKGNHISAIVSFRNDSSSNIKIITLYKGEVYTTRYECVSGGIVTKTVTRVKAEDYTKYSISLRGTITPYRPKKATHLVFTIANEDNERRSVEIFKQYNYTVVPVQDIKELNAKVCHYKKLGFEAATLFTASKREVRLSKLEEEAKNVIVNNFKIAHVTYEDRYTKVFSKKGVYFRKKKV